jgi:HTH-type transcriptional regulator, competence development regulator
MSSNNKAFGNKIRTLREERRKKDPAFSLRRFAQEIDVSAAFLSKVEIGEAPPPKAEKIIKMANLLGIDSDELLSLAGKVDPTLPEMILQRPVIADFLRTVNESLSDKEIEKFTDELKTNKP